MNLLYIFIGYAAGRQGHIINHGSLGYHHWLLGAFLYLFGNQTGRDLGYGLMLSDLNDMMHLRIFGADTVSTYNFWGID
jgi:hypothetical protein